MATRVMKHNLAGAVAFAILPMLLLLKTSISMLGEPSSAKAMIPATVVISPFNAGGPGVPWTEQQRAVAAHVEFLKDQPFGSSPLHRGGALIPTVRIPDVAVPELPPITVQMIMSSSTGTVALIDDHRCIVGDTLGKTDWVIVKIDAEALAVTFKHPRAGKTAVVVVQTPD